MMQFASYSSSTRAKASVFRPDKGGKMKPTVAIHEEKTSVSKEVWRKNGFKTRTGCFLAIGEEFGETEVAEEDAAVAIDKEVAYGNVTMDGLRTSMMK